MSHRIEYLVQWPSFHSRCRQPSTSLTTALVGAMSSGMYAVNSARPPDWDTRHSLQAQLSRNHT